MSFRAYIAELERRNCVAVGFALPGTGLAGEHFLPLSDEVRLPEDLKALWNEFGGTASDGQICADLWIDGSHYLFSERQAFDDYSAIRPLWDDDPHFVNYWPPGFVPFATPGDGSRLLVNCRAGSPTYGAVYELFHGNGVWRAAPSLNDYFSFMLKCLEQGALRAGPDHQLEPDYDKQAAIATELWPDCDAWNDELPKAYEEKDWLPVSPKKPGGFFNLFKKR